MPRLFCFSRARHENGPYAIGGQRRSRSACAAVHSDLSFLCSWTYTTLFTDSATVSNDYVSGQRRPRSACAFAQADQGLHCPKIA